MNRAWGQAFSGSANARCGESTRAAPTATIAAGDEPLDALQPEGDWPRGALVELLHQSSGNVLKPCMSALARLSHEGRWIALVSPPGRVERAALVEDHVNTAAVMLIHPRRNTQLLEAMERALRAGTCAAVVIWPGQVDNESAARLQQAAAAGGSVCILCRRAAPAERSTAATLSLQLYGDNADTSEARLLDSGRAQQANDTTTAPAVGAVWRLTDGTPLNSTQAAVDLAEDDGARSASAANTPRTRRRPAGNGPASVTQLDLPLGRA